MCKFKKKESGWRKGTKVVKKRISECPPPLLELFSALSWSEHNCIDFMGLLSEKLGRTEGDHFEERLDFSAQ